MITEKFNDLFYFAKKSKIKAGDGLKEGLYNFYTSSAKLSKRIDVFQLDKISLIFGTGGKASVHYVNEQFSTSTDCIVAIKKEEKAFNEKFVYYYLFGNIHILERGFKGAGLKHISKKYIQNLDIPILPIENQNKIVALLDKANALVQKRDKNITQLDELLRAQFLEMGDPVLNPKGWDVLYFKEVAKNENSKRVPIKKGDRALRQGIYPYYGATGIIDSFDDFKFDGDYLLIAEDGKNLLFRKKDNAFLAFGKFWVNNHAHVLSYNGITSLVYLMKFFNFLDLKAHITGIDQIKLNKTNLEKIPILVPPIDLQKEFETIYHNIQAQKETLIQSKMELENLYNSLLQRAFSGQLNFNVDIELDALLAAIDLNQDTEKEKHNIKEIATVYAGRLLERIEEQKFDNQIQYQQAKQVLFQMLEEGIVEQAYDEKTEAVKMKLV
jgi:type I restriction enzyme S subunit